MRADVLGIERRRRWTDDENARTVGKTLAAGAKVSEVMRRNDVAARVLFTWRRKARIPSTTVAPFIPISIVRSSANKCQ